MDLLIAADDLNEKKNKKELYYFNDCPHCNESKALIQNNNINNLSSLFSCPDITKCDCLINTPLKNEKNRKFKSNNTVATNISENHNGVSKENFSKKCSPEKELTKTPININNRKNDQNLKSPLYTLKVESPSTFLRFHLASSIKKRESNNNKMDSPIKYYSLKYKCQINFRSLFNTHYD